MRVIDEDDKSLYLKKLPCDLDIMLMALKPYSENLDGIAIESTFNWYWFVDGLKEQDYTIHLVNTAAVKQYDGLKSGRGSWKRARLCLLEYQKYKPINKQSLTLAPVTLAPEYFLKIAEFDSSILLIISPFPFPLPLSVNIPSYFQCFAWSYIVIQYVFNSTT